MKLTLTLILLASALVFGQEKAIKSDTTKYAIVVTEEMKESVDKVYNNPDAIKLLIVRLLNDKEYLRELHLQLMNDPSIKKGMQDYMKLNRESMRSNKNNMHEMHRNKTDSQRDTTGTNMH